MSNTRRTGFSGPDSLSPSDILAWSRLAGTMVSSSEFRLILAMDVSYISAVRTHMDEQRARYKSNNEDKKKGGKTK